MSPTSWKTKTRGNLREPQTLISNLEVMFIKLPKADWSKLKKVLYCGFFLLVFVRIFFGSWDHLDWATRYKIFSVPASTSAGGDSRNIKAAAYCGNEGYDYYEENACVERFAAPKYNYPSLWARAYSYFNNDSEVFFKKFWFINATLLVAMLTALSYRYNYLLLPYMLFSPITLLAMERGNTDAITAAITFLPLLLFNFKFLWGFTIGFAAALKIYPLFGFIAFLSLRRPYFPISVVFGALLAAPMIMLSISELPHIIAGTSKGFEVAYGLTSLYSLPFFNRHLQLTHTLITLFLVFSFLIVLRIYRSPSLIGTLTSDLKSLDNKSQLILAVSLSIFLFTFLLFTNWAYRLIFLIPALLILSQGKSKLFIYSHWIGMTIFWLPIIPYGWFFENLVCYLLSLPAALILIRFFSLDRLEMNSQGPAIL